MFCVQVFVPGGLSVVVRSLYEMTEEYSVDWRKDANVVMQMEVPV